MLNKERIRLMTKLAAYEQGEGKEYLPMGRFYRRDYIGFQMLKTLLYSTIAFGILFLLTFLYQMENIMEDLYQMDLREYIIGILVRYVIFVAVYQVIARVVYSRRYRKGHRSLKLYMSRLKKVEKLYEREETLLPLDDWEK